MAQRHRLRHTIVFTILLLVLMLLILSYRHLSYAEQRSHPRESRVLKNPVEDLSDEEAIAQFNEDFVLYLLYTIKAQRLHNPPLSKSTPKIEVFVDEDVYRAEVIDNVIYVGRGRFSAKDIVITTSAREAVQMLRDQSHIVESFAQGNSHLEIIEDKVTLFAKGYREIHNEVTKKT